MAQPISRIPPRLVRRVLDPFKPSRIRVLPDGSTPNVEEWTQDVVLRIQAGDPARSGVSHHAQTHRFDLIVGRVRGGNDRVHSAGRGAQEGPSSAPELGFCFEHGVSPGRHTLHSERAAAVSYERRGVSSSVAGTVVERRDA